MNKRVTGQNSSTHWEHACASWHKPPRLEAIMFTRLVAGMRTWITYVYTYNYYVRTCTYDIYIYIYTCSNYLSVDSNSCICQDIACPTCLANKHSWHSWCRGLCHQIPLHQREGAGASSRPQLAQARGDPRFRSDSNGGQPNHSKEAMA